MHSTTTIRENIDFLDSVILDCLFFLTQDLSAASTVPFRGMVKAKLQRSFIWKVHTPSDLSRVCPACLRQHREDLKTPLISQRSPSGCSCLVCPVVSRACSLVRKWCLLFTGLFVSSELGISEQEGNSGKRPADKAVS